MIRIAYLVHNLNDAAVERRVRMFRAGGADVAVAGFQRSEATPADIAGAPVTALGKSHDSRLWQRGLLVARAMIRPDSAKAVSAANVVIARNLEMLVLAARLRRPGQRLVYECLDIHRIMLGRGPAGAVLRSLERRLMASTQLLITSSPAFKANYFDAIQHSPVSALLVENKLLALGPAQRPVAPAHTPGSPWTIGWFGNLRCRRSLAELARLAAQLEGRARVLVAGVASPSEFPEFAKAVNQPHVDYAGTYGAGDLPGLYARCHFSWCIDYFEEGLNSEWLLPNRLYESIACGAVPVARAGTETAHWLGHHGAGVILSRDDGLAQLGELVKTLEPGAFDRLLGAVKAIPRYTVTADQAECEDLVSAVAP